MIQFLHNKELVTVASERADLTVLQWLREVRNKTGTKEGCGSGDCGACTVVVASVATHEGKKRLVYESANSCILFVGALHAKQLITVENLAEANRLHPVQQAMVDEHGSQCGFCTPGFVMSLFAMAHSEPHALSSPAGQHKKIERALGGNLCRCTGYKPIVRAAERVLDLPESDQFSSAETETIDRLDELLKQKPMHPRFMTPTTLNELGAMWIQYPRARLLAGGTDLALEVTQQLNDINDIIFVKMVPELMSVESNKDHIRIGAGVSLNRCMQLLKPLVPDSESMMLRFGSEQVRNQGTMGGNIANASPIGDLPPLLMSMQAELELLQGETTRTVAINDFYLDYKQTRMQANECIVAITIPVPAETELTRIYKISKRFDDDISTVCGVFTLSLSNNVVKTARIAFGGMAATPKRATAVEQALLNQPFNEATISQAVVALTNDFSPISDARASAAYRRRVAANLLKRCWLELSHPEARLQVSDYVSQ